jgi:hypothetical protein
MSRFVFFLAGMVAGAMLARPRKPMLSLVPEIGPNQCAIYMGGKWTVYESPRMPDVVVDSRGASPDVVARVRDALRRGRLRL